MGRRAKNKQSAPEPLAAAKVANDRPSAKKLGKRKADADVDAKENLSKRPAKKARETDGRVPNSMQGKTQNQALEKGKKLGGKIKSKRRDDEDEDEGEASGSSSEGWEGVEDDEEVRAQAKYVSHYACGAPRSSHKAFLDHSSMTATTRTHSSVT